MCFPKLGASRYVVNFGQGAPTHDQVETRVTHDLHTHEVLEFSNRCEIKDDWILGGPRDIVTYVFYKNKLDARTGSISYEEQ